MIYRPFKASSSFDSVRAISASDTMSGGTKRTTCGPAGTTSTPFLLRWAATAAAVDPLDGISCSSIPTIRPSPRTSATRSGYLVKCKRASRVDHALLVWPDIDTCEREGERERERRMGHRKKEEIERDQRHSHIRGLERL